jgi:hypothetical protein
MLGGIVWWRRSGSTPRSESELSYVVSAKIPGAFASAYGFEWLGIEPDEDGNRAGEMMTSADRSRVRLLVAKTNEEMMIARHTARCLEAAAEAFAAG